MKGKSSPFSSVHTSRGLTVTVKVGKVHMATLQPFLSRLDAQSIRVFPRVYDAYCRELKSHASQLVQDGSMSLEPIRSVGLVHCLDGEQLKSALNLGMIDDCEDVKNLSDNKLRAFLDKEAVAFATIVTGSDLSSIVVNHVRIDMSVKSATGRMLLLFIDYKSLLRQHGMAWVAKKTKRKPWVMPHRSSSRRNGRIDLWNTYHSRRSIQRRTQGRFLKHALHLSVAFERLDNGNPCGRQSEVGGGSANTGSKTKLGNKPASKTSQDRGNKRPPPLPYPMKACEGKNRMHWVDDCEHTSAREKNDFKDELFAARARDGPARSTRSQVSSNGNAASSASRSVGRLCQDKKNTNMADESSSCIITVSDWKVSLDVTGRCDNVSDKNIASTALAKRAVLKGIRKIEAIETISLEIALTKKNEKLSPYAFSRAWRVPATDLHLNSGRLALNNIRFLVANDVVACEDLLIERPVLLHLRVDTRILLGDRVTLPDGTDYSPELLRTTTSELVSRIMVARLNGGSNDWEHSPPSVNPDCRTIAPGAKIFRHNLV